MKHADEPHPVEWIVGLHQTIYEHGGSRIWIERDGKRDLLADTYGDETLANAVMVCVRAYLQPNGLMSRPATSKRVARRSTANCGTAGYAERPREVCHERIFSAP